MPTLSSTVPHLTSTEVLALLFARIRGRSIRAVAEEMDISPGYLYDVLACKRQPGPAILAHLRLEKIETRTVAYRRKGK